MKNLMKQITKNGRIFWVTYFTFFLILAMPTHAWAYVDPATLTYVVQIIAGVFIAGGVAVGVYWRKSRSFSLRTKHLLRSMSQQSRKEMQQQQRLRNLTKTNRNRIIQREEYK